MATSMQQIEISSPPTKGKSRLTFFLLKWDWITVPLKLILMNKCPAPSPKSARDRITFVSNPVYEIYFQNEKHILNMKNPLSPGTHIYLENLEKIKH